MARYAMVRNVYQIHYRMTFSALQKKSLTSLSAFLRAFDFNLNSTFKEESYGPPDNTRSECNSMKLLGNHSHKSKCYLLIEQRLSDFETRTIGWQAY